MNPAKIGSASQALARMWAELSADQKSAVAPFFHKVGVAELGGALPALADRFGADGAPPTANASAPHVHATAPRAGGAHATLAQHAVPTAADQKRVDTMVSVALAGFEQLPSQVALLEKIFSRAAWSTGAALAARALSGVSLADTWRGLVALGRVVVVGVGGLAGDAAYYDTQGRVLMDSKALARLAPEERRFVVLRVIVEAALDAVSKKNPPGPNRDHGAPAGFNAARATALARALLSNPPAIDLEGKALYYPAGGSDVKSVRGIAERVRGLGSAVSIDIAYASAHELPVQEGLTFHAVPGDALRGDVAATVRTQVGASIGGVQLLAPGDFGGLRREPSFIATTLGALDTGGVIFNHHAWGYAPLTRQLPPAFLGLALTDVIGADGHGDVEVLTKTRELPDGVKRGVHQVDRLVACFVERLQTGRLGQMLSSDAWTRPFAERQAPYLPELEMLALALEDAGDPHLSGLVWQQLWRESEQPAASITLEERCVIAAHAMQTSAFAGATLKETAVKATSTAPSSSTEEAASFIARLIAGEKLPGSIGDELAALERVLPHVHGTGSQEQAALLDQRALASFLTSRLSELGPSSGDLSSWSSAGADQVQRALFGLLVIGDGEGDAALAQKLVAAAQDARHRLAGHGDDADKLSARLSLDAVVLEAQARHTSTAKG